MSVRAGSIFSRLGVRACELHDAIQLVPVVFCSQRCVGFLLGVLRVGRVDDERAGAKFASDGVAVVDFELDRVCHGYLR